MTTRTEPVPETLVAAAKKLWGQHGCTCAPVDNGVGVQHEPYCGDPSPEDVAEFAYNYAASERAAVAAAAITTGTLRQHLASSRARVDQLLKELADARTD